eukprot:TRINITY_DN952_c0_g1_i5.p1 TRINITY_DN952_c0_g1~~TRINITY_DN952_c0_g1_i5.p1  ORF type:complete len:569 (+),score=150.18 TRINITY_DN952_c0_g1_i5:161-1867(+)
MSLQTNEQTTATTSTPSTTTPTVATTSSEPKEEDIGISLRPGGGSRKKPALSTSTSTSASESQPPTKQTSRPGWNDTKTKSKDSNTPSSNYNAPSSSPSKESVNDFPVGEPFTSETNEAKQEYDRTYISKFRTLCTDAPQELQESLVEFPELQPKVASMLNTSGQFSYGGGGNYPQRQFSGSSFQFQQGGQGFQQGQYFNQSGFPQEGSSGFPQQQRGPPSKFAKQPYPQQQRRPPGAQSGMPMTNKSTELGRRAENPWAPRPSFLKDEKDQVLRDIKGVLNKITPEKFTKLSTKIQDLFGQVTDDQIFAESISLVFAKAVSEPNFSKLYAELCVKLSDVAVKVPDGKLAFRRALLNRCQEEFERASRKVEDLPEDPEERALAKEKDRKNKLGNVKFIGELFKMTLLAERIIHGCIKILFNTIYKYKDDKETVEMNSELLCKLVATTGKRMDNPEAKSYMDTYFSHIQKLSQAPTISSRIRFMFQNLIELRENNWIPRREENAPKKISEVHADALQKAYEEEYNLNQPAPEIKATTTKAPAEVAKPAVDAKKKNKKKKKKATEIVSLS